MMAEAIDSAAADAGDVQLVSEADLLACVEPIAWGYDHLTTTVGEMAGTTGPMSPSRLRALLLRPGGNSPCELLNQIANRIVDGDSRIALLAGAEALYSRRRARKQGVDLRQQGWTPYGGHRDFLKGQRPLTNELEARHGLTAPIHCYPLYENALRAEACRTIQQHHRYLGEMMSAHSAVAAANRYAWFPVAYTPDEITEITPDNRAVCFPYPKRMNAIMEVDLAAALVVMSNEEADRRAIPDDRRVAFLGGGSATDAWTPTERASLTSSPAYRASATAALEHAGLYATEVGLFDLYSCFPSAVEIAMKALSLALDDPRPRTVTGGLAYAGGPGNNYSMHALAAMVERLRGTTAKVGYVSALGMTATKHAVSILSTTHPDRPRPAGRRAISRSPDKLRFGPPVVDAPAAGPATIETYTVEYGRDGKPARIDAGAEAGRRTAHGRQRRTGRRAGPWSPMKGSANEGGWSRASTAGPTDSRWRQPVRDRARAAQRRLPPAAGHRPRPARAAGPGWRCVDVGAGGGDVTVALAEIVGPGRPRLRRRQRPAGPRRGGPAAAEAAQAQVMAITQAGEDLTLPEPVDLAFCRFLLLHVVDPVVVLARMGDAVRPGGWVVAQEPITSAGRIGGRPFSMPDARHPDVGALLPALVRDAGLELVDAWAEAPAWVGPGPVADYLEALTEVDPGDDPSCCRPWSPWSARRRACRRRPVAFRP